MEMKMRTPARAILDNKIKHWMNYTVLLVSLDGNHGLRDGQKCRFEATIQPPAGDETSPPALTPVGPEPLRWRPRPVGPPTPRTYLSNLKRSANPLDQKDRSPGVSRFMTKHHPHGKQVLQPGGVSGDEIILDLCLQVASLTLGLYLTHW
jgi:hypothetical protein